MQTAEGGVAVHKSEARRLVECRTGAVSVVVPWCPVAGDRRHRAASIRRDEDGADALVSIVSDVQQGVDTVVIVDGYAKGVVEFRIGAFAVGKAVVFSFARNGRDPSGGGVGDVHGADGAVGVGIRKRGAGAKEAVDDEYAGRTIPHTTVGSIK